MSILGVQSLLYGTDDLDSAVQFYDDFGLEIHRRDDSGADFQLGDGSTIVLRRNDDPDLPPRFTDSPGVREVIWGVDSAASLEALGNDLAKDRKVALDPDGGLHTVDDAGIAVGFRVFVRRALDAADATENTPTAVKRWNLQRKWFDRARPNVVNHIGWGVPNVDAAMPFYTKRLGFRITDISRRLGVFLRCDGRHEHHNLFLLQTGREIRWHHVCFGVENIDELMAGANHMQLNGWKTRNGIGRHRIASALHYYMPNPAGGESEYGADTDYLTDDWKPRLWAPDFGNHFWYGKVPDNIRELPVRKVRVIESPVESFAEFDNVQL